MGYIKKFQILFFTLILFILISPKQSSAATVMTGLDVLEQSNFSQLKNKRVGLITNQTAIDSKGNYILDVFSRQNQFKLAAVFTPEHGLRGQDDKEYIPSEKYGENIPVYSLYGDVRKPTNQMLNGIDVLVYDIQDVGTRYYTFITTMAYCIEAAASRGIPFIVLDRPDPIGGNIVEGEVLNYKFRSFTGYFSIPTRYAMTAGEVAQYYKGEGKLNINLSVIKMRNWNRNMFYDETGLKWINPSPNMRSLNAAVVYPGLGMLESVNLSVGRGTDQPFMYYGAPWIDNSFVLINQLNDKKLPGLRFEVARFTPKGSIYSGQITNGFKVIITDKKQVRSVDAMIYTLDILNTLYPGKLNYEGMKRSFGSSLLTDMLDGKYTPVQLISILKDNQDNFEPIRKKYLLY